MWKPLTVFYVSLPGNIRFRIGSRMFPGGETYGSALRNVKNKKIHIQNRTNLPLSFQETIYFHIIHSYKIRIKTRLFQLKS